MRIAWVSLATVVVSVLSGVLLAEETDQAFNLDQIMDVQIRLADEDWDLIRRQHASLEPDDSSGMGNSYSYVQGTVTINGATFGPVGLRKKGFIGSHSNSRPSLKVHFSKYAASGTFHDMKRLTLNNNQQDPSCLHQLLTYHVFRKAGVPAPRCSFATVTVNGDYKGLYTNVEPVKKPFLRRHFSDDEGDLYEGRKSDFRKGWTASFEKKTNKGDAARRDLDEVARALELDDDQLLPAVDKVIDVDAFLRFWAVEVLVGHWDGYCENQNNFYVYRNPETNQFHFIPWGADSGWGDPNSFLSFEPPPSVRAMGYLTRRLYNHPDTRRRYRDTLRSLLEEVWDEAELLAIVERFAPVVMEKQSPQLASRAAGFKKIRDFINNRRQILLADLNKPAELWEYEMEESPFGGEPRGTITATFSAPWTPAIPFIGSKAEIKLDWDQEMPEFVTMGAMAQPFPDLFRSGYPHILIGGFIKPGGKIFGASLIIDPDQLKPGAELQVDWFNVLGAIIEIDVASGAKAPRMRGMLTGKLRVDQVDLKKGGKITGTLEATIR